VDDQDEADPADDASSSKSARDTDASTRSSLGICAEGDRYVTIGFLRIPEIALVGSNDVTMLVIG
jgi:hypothetical protein